MALERCFEVGPPRLGLEIRELQFRPRVSSEVLGVWACLIPSLKKLQSLLNPKPQNPKPELKAAKRLGSHKLGILAFGSPSVRIRPGRKKASMSHGVEGLGFKLWLWDFGGRIGAFSRVEGWLKTPKPQMAPTHGKTAEARIFNSTTTVNLEPSSLTYPKHTNCHNSSPQP